MTAVPSDARPGRVARVRAHLTADGLTGLVVSHPANLTYLTGLRASAGVAVLTAHRLVVVVDFRYAEAAGAALAGLADSVGAVLEVAPQSLDTSLARVLSEGDGGRVGVEAAYLSVKRYEWLRTALDGTGASLVPTERLVERERLVKDAGEVEILREAGRRLSGIAARLGEYAAAGRQEREVAADLDQAVRQAGFEAPAFDTIVASGPNGARPHARPGPRQLTPGDGVVLDFGGVYDGYCVDLTRTVSIGAPGRELERLHRAVLEAFEAARAAVRPGVLATSVDEAARAALVRHGLGDAFGHGTGHGLGLEVHEEPRIGRPVNGLPATRLAPGMVFTVEPGAYVAGLGGVRIEDDVLVTGDGHELLTDAPRALVVV
jgi:Xaa-Pro aminopeptidase